MTMWAGIDYDTKAVHICLLPESGSARYWSRELDGFDPFERARSVRSVMPARKTWKDWGVVALGLEEQNSGNPKMRSSVQKLKVIQGAILSCLPRDLLVEPIAGPRWRAIVRLPGNASKDEVREMVGDRWADHPTPLTYDASDAYCLALAVRLLTLTHVSAQEART